MKTKLISIIIGFIISWVYSAISFHPQPHYGGNTWTISFMSTLIFTVPINGILTVLTLILSKKLHFIKRVFSNIIFLITLSIFLILSLWNNWNYNTTNDTFFVIDIILGSLIWTFFYWLSKSMITQNQTAKEKRHTTQG